MIAVLQCIGWFIIYVVGVFLAVTAILVILVGLDFLLSPILGRTPTETTIVIRSETGEEIARYTDATVLDKSGSYIKLEVEGKTYAYTGGIIEQITQKKNERGNKK